MGKKDAFTHETPIGILSHILNDNVHQLGEPVLEEIGIDLVEYLQYFFNEEILGD